METVRILFLPASGRDVGGGHVLRGLALAAALEERGATCGFAVEPEGARLLSQFGGGLGVETLERTDSLAVVADRWGADAVVADDYRLDAAGEAGLATDNRALAAIDDLADRAHRAGLLVDPSYGRDPGDYAALLPPGATVLAGPSYALLRPAFADAPPIAIRPKVERVFVGFGLADPGGVTRRAVATLLKALLDVAVDAVVGAQAASVADLRALASREPRLSLHVEPDRVAELMARADIAVGAGGASTWERFRLGLPSLCVIVAENQRALANRLASEGLQITLDFEAPDFDAALAQAASALSADVARRRRLSEAGRRIVDGQGARRVAEALLRAVSECRR